MLHSRISLLIHSKGKSLHLLIPSSQSMPLPERQIPYDIPDICNLIYGTNESSHRKKIMDLENRHVVANGDGKGVGWIGGLGLIDADYCLWNGLAMRSCCVALRTMSSHLWWSMIMCKNIMCTCMCNWVTMLYSRKLTEHCKPAMMEKNFLKNKNHYIK